MVERDEEKYSRFLSGETKAYDELMIRYGDSLTFYLNGYLHNWMDAEDLMIEAFARIMVKKPFIQEGCFKAYLYKTARNLAARFAVSQKQKQGFYLEDLEEMSDPAVMESYFQDEEKRKTLYLCLERIDKEFREALWLVYMEELSYEQASKVMNVSRKKIDNLLMRGKHVLRRELEKEGITNAYE